MNFSFYIFGTPKGRYNQYPDDYIASTLTRLQKNTDGARLVIQREMNLTHYVYTERVDESNVIGFCLIFNNARILKPKQLISFFRYIIEKRLVESGKIIKYNDNGRLQYVVDSFSECAKENEKLREFINDELENNSSKYEIETLSSTYNGTKTIDTIDISASDAQIVQLTDKHNTVIINSKEGVEHGYIERIMASIREENAEARKKNAELQEANKKLTRQKKQYRYVILLTLIILGCGVGLFFLNDNLRNTQEELAEANQTISSKNQRISELNENVENLNESLSEERNLREQVENDFSSFKSSLNDIQPFIVKSTSFNFSTGWLSFDYYGFRNETVTIVVKAFGEYSYSNSSSIDIERGYHSNSIYLSSGLNSSKWYSFELLVGNKIVGGDRH